MLDLSMPQRGKRLVEIIMYHNIAPEEQNNCISHVVMPLQGMISYSNYISTNLLPRWGKGTFIGHGGDSPGIRL